MKMRQRGPCFVVWGALLFPLGATAVARAQTATAPSSAPFAEPQAAGPVSAPAPASMPDSNPEPGAEELAEIQAALAADTAARVAPASTDSTSSSELAPPESGLTAGNALNPAISLIGDVALAYFSQERNLQRGGHDPTQTGFNLQQLELSVQAAIDPYFTFNSNIVFSLFGVEVEEAYGTTTSLPYNMQLRAGQFLTRFGRANPTHPHSWDMVDQPIVIGKFFGSEGNRGLGTELSVLLPLPWYVEPVLAVLGDSGGATCRSFYGNTPRPIQSPTDLIYVGALKQFFPLSQDWSLAWGLSTAMGPNASGAGNRTDIFGTDLYVKWRPISYGSYTVVALETEWMLRRRQLPGDLLQDWGGYTKLFWRFAQRWAVAGRYDVVSGVAKDPLDPEQTSAEHRLAVNISFWPTEFSRLRLQYSVDLPTYRDQPIHAVFLTLELVSGAHGAHQF
ncbi:MAG: zinc-regulated TonB-dependent outer membrane receptor [Pseudomonadota bacterium]